MRLRTWRFLTGLVAVALLAGCRGSDSLSVSDAQITLRAQFEKRPLSPAGLGAGVPTPSRYCWAEVRDAGSNALLASGYLGSDGTGTAYVPKGLSVYVVVFAQYQVPSADPNGFFMRGSVKHAPLPSTYLDATTFAAIPEWSVTSPTFLVDRDGTLPVTAPASTRVAGAFNIADQAVTFAAAVRDMDGSSTLRLPNLHTFWTTSTLPADHTRTYPEVTWSSATTFLTSSSGRALFSHAVNGLATGAANTETDEWDDGVLQETFARLLFADYSYKPDGSDGRSLLRRDNDNVWVDRTVQSESSAAFVAGFSDFLACAVRGDSHILDSYVDSAGAPQVAAFDLTDHTYVPASAKGEFARGSIAVSLWGLWKNVLGGNAAGLNTLWAAVRSAAVYTDGTGEYQGAALGCHPTYLQGVASRLTAPTWLAAVNELALEGIANPTTAYFAGTALWKPISLGVTATDALQTYPSTWYYDRNQSQAWRFTHSGGSRTLTMTPTSGQDFYLELLGPGGWVAGSTGSDRTGLSRTLTVPSLPAGVYVARVRAGRTTLSGLNTYSLVVN